MTERLRVAVLYGGTSSEREISLASGEVVFRHLDPGKFEARLVDLRELLPGGSVDLRAFAAATDVAFLALHGPGGEDGRGPARHLVDARGHPEVGAPHRRPYADADGAVQGAALRRQG